jgi:hypothetical protein
MSAKAPLTGHQEHAYEESATGQAESNLFKA